MERPERGGRTDGRPQRVHKPLARDKKMEKLILTGRACLIFLLHEEIAANREREHRLPWR